MEGASRLAAAIMEMSQAWEIKPFIVIAGQHNRLCVAFRRYDTLCCYGWNAFVAC